MPVWDESRLGVAYVVVQNRFQSIGQNFGNGFVDNTAQANRSKVFQTGWVQDFGDERDDSMIDRFKHKTIAEKGLNCWDDITLDNAPEPLEEQGGHVILAWSFIRLHGEKS